MNIAELRAHCLGGIKPIPVMLMQIELAVLGREDTAMLPIYTVEYEGVQTN